MRCPTCRSEDVEKADADGSPIAVCQNCATVVVPEMRENPAIELCDDCAFRPNSPERQDPYKWAEIIEVTIVNGDHPFYCHKGLTCELHGTTLSYNRPEEGTRAMTPCAGWRSRMAAYRAGIPARRL